MGFSGGCRKTSFLISRTILKTLARPPRLERGTPGLEGRCSIQLSYGRICDGTVSVTLTYAAFSIWRGAKAAALRGVFAPRLHHASPISDQIAASHPVGRTRRLADTLRSARASRGHTFSESNGAASLSRATECHDDERLKPSRCLRQNSVFIIGINSTPALSTLLAFEGGLFRDRSVWQVALSFSRSFSYTYNTIADTVCI
jgi:hypothetical protein